MTANILRAPKRRRAVVVILAIAVASVRASSQQIDSTSRASAKQMMLAAQRALLRDGNPAAAKAGFQTAIRQDSTFAAPRFARNASSVGG